MRAFELRCFEVDQGILSSFYLFQASRYVVARMERLHNHNFVIYHPLPRGILHQAGISSGVNMANLDRCRLCQPINVNDIVAGGLKLPLHPYLLAWQKGSDLHPRCGLCKLLKSCLFVHMLRDDQSAVLLFKHNEDYGIIVVIATTMHFATTSIYPELLCGPTAEQWSYDSKSRFSCAFLRMNMGIGT